MIAMSPSTGSSATPSGYQASVEDNEKRSGQVSISNTADDGQEAQLRDLAPRLRGRTLTAALAFVAGTGFTLFGYVS